MRRCTYGMFTLRIRRLFSPFSLASFEIELRGKENDFNVEKTVFLRRL